MKSAEFLLRFPGLTKAGGSQIETRGRCEIHSSRRYRLGALISSTLAAIDAFKPALIEFSAKTQGAIMPGFLDCYSNLCSDLDGPARRTHPLPPIDRRATALLHRRCFQCMVGGQID